MSCERCGGCGRDGSAGRGLLARTAVAFLLPLLAAILAQVALADRLGELGSLAVGVALAGLVAFAGRSS